MSTFDVWVTRAVGGNLHLRTAYDDADSHGYLLENPEEVLNPGAVAWRRNMVQSPYADGEYEVSAVMGEANMAFNVLITSPDAVSQRNQISTLISAVTQRTFQLHVKIDGTEYAWQCKRADFSVKMNRRFIHARSAIVTVQCPRFPIPVLGPV